MSTVFELAATLVDTLQERSRISKKYTAQKNNRQLGKKYFKDI